MPLKVMYEASGQGKPTVGQLRMFFTNPAIKPDSEVTYSERIEEFNGEEVIYWTFTVIETSNSFQPIMPPALHPRAGIMEAAGIVGRTLSATQSTERQG